MKWKIKKNHDKHFEELSKEIQYNLTGFYQNLTHEKHREKWKMKIEISTCRYYIMCILSEIIDQLKYQKSLSIPIKLDLHIQSIILQMLNFNWKTSCFNHTTSFNNLHRITFLKSTTGIVCSFKPEHDGTRPSSTENNFAYNSKNSLVIVIHVVLCSLNFQISN